MKSKEGAINLDFMGGLTKFGPKNGEVRQFQVKTFGNTNDSEIDGIAREFSKWATHGLVTKLQNFENLIPGDDGYWTIKLDMRDYGIFFDVDFGHDIHTGEPGIVFKALLTTIEFKRVGNDRVGTFTFVKNGDDFDDKICRCFLNKKEETVSGKKPKAFKIILKECESFTIGNAPVESDEGDNDDIFEDNGPEPVVYSAPEDSD